MMMEVFYASAIQLFPCENLKRYRVLTKFYLGRYEKLQRWDDALNAYTAKASQPSSAHLVLDAILGLYKLTCVNLYYCLEYSIFFFWLSCLL